MRYGHAILGVGVVAIAAFSFLQIAGACGDYKSMSENSAPLMFCAVSTQQVDELTKLTGEAVSEKSEIAQPAINALRKEGREGLEKFLSVHREVIEQHAAAASNAQPDPRWPRVKFAFDSISGQYDCHSSKLFWHTDLEQAKAAAQKSGKPILSLRLLGKLTDEFSCANSRFFRSTLYANKDVSDALREKRFVLHWQTVRPVPRVTIDFGDGRKLERTLTGNSVHYILDSNGQVIDALPGLYGPKAFLRGLETAEVEVAAIKNMNDAQRIARLQAYHDAQEKQILAAWQRDLAQLNLLPQTSPVTVAQAPRAAAANQIAESKGRVEASLLVATLPDVNVLATATDDAVWGRIAELHQGDAELDASSIAFIRMQNPNAARAGKVAVSKMVVENPMVRLVRNFQNTIGIDTVRNEYTLHRQFHEWFVKNEVPADVDVNMLNEKVYAQLFLTPSSDPWLGLMPGDVYTALDNNGVAKN